MTTQQRTIYLVPARVAPRPVVAPRMPVQRTAPAPMHHQPAIRRVHHAPPVQKPTLKRPLVESPSPEDPLEALLNEGTGMGLPRKREKLNHLTVEEKMDRRKLKNRVAAQTARDRKKVRSQRMEDVLRQLMEENQRLREENSRLKAEKQQQKEWTPAEGAGRLPAAADLPSNDLIPQDVFERLFQEIQEEFDLDQLASELPCGQPFPNEETAFPVAGPSFAPAPIVGCSMNQVPCSPSSSTAESLPSPLPVDDWLNEYKQEEDPMLASPGLLATVDHEESIFAEEDPSFSVGSPFDNSFNQEFFSLF